MNSFLTGICLFLNNWSGLIHSVLTELKFNISRLANIWPIHKKSGNLDFEKSQKRAKSADR